MVLTLFPTYTHVQATESERSQLGMFMRKEIPGVKNSQKFQNLKRVQGADAWDGTQCFFNYKANTFPIGLTTQVVEQFKVPKENIIDRRKSMKMEYRHPQLIGITMRDYQREATMRAIQAKSCLIRVATNGGKSIIAAGILQLLRQERALILIHQQQILWQLRTEIMKALGVFVGFVTSDEVVLDPYINIAMMLTMNNRLDVDPVVTKMFMDSNCVLVDEVHHGGSATYESLLSRSQATYRIGMSGTIQPKTSFEGWKVRQYLGEVVIDITNAELIDAGISAVPTICFIPYGHQVPWGEMELECERESGKDMSHWSIRFKKQFLARAMYRKVVDRYVRQNAERTKMIVNLIARVFAGKQSLIIVDNIDQGEAIHKGICEICGNDVAVFLQGNSKKQIRRNALSDYKENKFRVLIATSVLDEGISLSAIQVLVLASSKKSERVLLQRIGRGLRRKEGENTVTIIDIFDMDEKFLENQANIRHELYKEEGFGITFNRYIDVNGLQGLEPIKEYQSFLHRRKKH